MKKKTLKLLTIISPTIISLIIISLVFIAIPLLMDYFLFGNNFSTNLNNSEWSGFLGSYIGSLIGAIATIAGVWYGFHLDSKKQIDSEIRENSLIVYYDLVLGLTDLKKLYINLQNDSFTNIPTKMFFSSEWIKNVAKVSNTEKNTGEIYKLYGDLESVCNQLKIKNDIMAVDPKIYDNEKLNIIVSTVSERVFSNKFLTSIKEDYSNESDISLNVDDDLNEDTKLVINGLKKLKDK